MTNSIPSDRANGVGIQNFTDALFLRSDGTHLGLGDGQVGSLGATTSDVSLTIRSGASMCAHGVTTVRPTVSDGWYLKSDTAGGGFFLMASSG